MTETLSTTELSDSARRFLSEQFNRHSAWQPDGNFADGFRSIAELGWTQLTIPESHDGLGQDFRALAAIYSELGRALSPVPLMSSMVAVEALLALDASCATALELVKMIGSGELIVTVAFARAGELYCEDAASGEVLLCADLRNVIDAQVASHVLILPSVGDGPVILLNLQEPGVTMTPVQMWDRSRRPADIRVAGSAVRLLCGANPDVQSASALALAHLDLALAWDSIGGGMQALEESVAYMATRRQFNRPVGSFQALKHRAADLKVGLELASALAVRASTSFAKRSSGWARLAAQARLLAVRVYSDMGEEMVQFHGGIGVTWEHDCHRFLKRAKFNELGGERLEAVMDRISAGM